MLKEMVKLRPLEKDARINENLAGTLQNISSPSPFVDRAMTFPSALRDMKSFRLDKRDAHFIQLLGRIQSISLSRGRLPIHHAAEHFDLEDVELISQSGIDVNSKDFNGNTPLMYATARNRSSVVEFLVKVGANACLTNERGWTALHYACMNGSDECAAILIRAKCPVDSSSVDGMTALHWASTHGHISCAKMLLDNNSNSNAQTVDGRTPLHLAARYRHDTICLLLLERGADWNVIDKSKATPLVLIVENGCQKSVEFVGSRISSELSKSNEYASFRNNQGDYLIHIFARRGCILLLQKLIEIGVDLAATNYDKENVLHLAVRGGNEDIISLLLRCRPDLYDLKNKNDKTALDIANVEGRTSLVNFMKQEIQGLGSNSEAKKLPQVKKKK